MKKMIDYLVAPEKPKPLKEKIEDARKVDLYKKAEYLIIAGSAG